MKKKAERESPIDYLIKSLEYGIKALKQYQADKKQEIERHKEACKPMER